MSDNWSGYSEYMPEFNVYRPVRKGELEEFCGVYDLHGQIETLQKRNTDLRALIALLEQSKAQLRTLVETQEAVITEQRRQLADLVEAATDARNYLRPYGGKEFESLDEALAAIDAQEVMG
jgi:DNA repair exonuclease SbcCD ATPase subunit